MNKKGISQIIAIVLLVVFLIIISMIIFSFMSRTATQETTKGADKATAQEICRENIKIRIKNVEIFGDRLKIYIENLKAEDITKFIIRLKEGNQLDVVNKEQPLGGYEIAILEIETSIKPDTVEVMPQIILKKPDITSVTEGWWLCSEQIAVYKVS